MATPPSPITNNSMQVNGKVTDSGSLDITSIGFVYSSSVTYPTKNQSDCKYLDVNLSKMDDLGNFQDIVTGLTSNTIYYFRSYAENPIGISYSIESVSGTTNGITNIPQITFSLCSYITPYYYPQQNFEIGVNYYIVVSGQTIKNDEINFAYGDLRVYYNNYSSIISVWTGYSNDYMIGSYNYLPVSENTDNHILTFKTTQWCGIDDYYSVTGSSIANACYPFLWVMKSESKNADYFKAKNGNYFYKDASLNNGKLIEKITGETTMVFSLKLVEPNNYLIFGYLDSYNKDYNVSFGIDGINWSGITNNNSNIRLVETGLYENEVINFMSPWQISGQHSVSYRVITYKYEDLGFQEFYIKFVSYYDEI